MAASDFIQKAKKKDQKQNDQPELKELDCLFNSVKEAEEFLFYRSEIFDLFRQKEWVTDPVDVYSVG